MVERSKRKLEEEDADDEEVSTSGDELGEQDGSEEETSNSGTSSSGKDDSDSEEGGEEGDTVDVDLEFFDPSERDFHGLKALLRTYLDDSDFSGCSELVETLIKQVHATCMCRPVAASQSIPCPEACSMCLHRTRWARW